MRGWEIAGQAGNSRQRGKHRGVRTWRGRRPRKRGRPRTTLESRLRDLCTAYSRARAETSSTLAPGAPRPASLLRFWKEVARAQRAGLLDVPGSWWREAAVQAARVRARFHATFRRPGRPTPPDQRGKDKERKLIIKAAQPAHSKWESLFREVREDPLMPRSWSSFLKLLTRVGIPHEAKAPNELARELDVVPPGPPAPRREPEAKLQRRERRRVGAARRPEDRQYAKRKEQAAAERELERQHLLRHQLAKPPALGWWIAGRKRRITP